MRLWPFARRKPRPVRDVRDECGTWRAGDLAVCIAIRWCDPCAHSPRAGEVLRVTEVDEAEIRGVLIRGLSFAGKPDDHCWDASGFRKAVRDDQPASAEFRLPTRQPERIDA